MMADSSMKDWPIDLRRSAAMGDLMMQIYLSHCEWLMVRPDWTDVPWPRRQMIRDMATEILERLARS